MSIEKTIIYKHHHLARRLTLRVTPESQIIVTLPRRASIKQAEKFVRDQEAWITAQLENHHSRPRLTPVLTTQEIERAKIKARALVLNKLLHFNEHYHLSYLSVSIRSQSTRWGSCSRRRHLSFNYKLVFLSEELTDYIVVHELCHLQEMNHSKNFWLLVAETIPQYAKLRHELRSIRL